MYPASNAFHQAVANGNPQKALLIFSDRVFTNDDINVEDGIELHDYFNTEDDICIGQASSNELTFGLFNDDRDLNNFEFGEFTATLGVRISRSLYTQDGNVQAVVGSKTFIGYTNSPYIKMNGTALSTQPTQRISSMLAYDGKLYCFGRQQDYVIVYNASTGAVINNVTVCDFMKKKAYRYWQYQGMHYDASTRLLKIWKDGIFETYEFVPLGKFIANRPKVPDVIQIDMTCNDFMTKFDVDMPKRTALGFGYPVPIGTLYRKMCEYLHVPYKTDVFINSTAILKEPPDEFDNCTMRDVLKWIAEAAGSNAKFDRDGVLDLVWFTDTDQTYTESGYSEFNPCWYETKKVTKLLNRDTRENGDWVYGNGDEGYLIQDNPLLRGVI